MLFLVTGVGHSGTKWCAQLFAGLGFECGHERWHNLKPYEGMETPDSSALAVPNLPLLEDMPVIHIVRDPLLVLRSVMRSRATAHPREMRPYNRYIATHLGQDLDAPALDRMVHLVAEWDRPVEGHPRRMVLQVDRAGPDEVAAVVRYATGQRAPVGEVAAVMARLGTRVNEHYRHRIDVDQSITWDRLRRRPYGSQLRERAERYGYT